MKSLGPEQLVLLLVLLVLAFLVPLFNLLVRWLQRRASDQAPRPPAPVARETPRASGPMPRARLVEPSLPFETSRKTPAVPPAEPVRRRAGALGGPPAVRRAIVTMTILGPCRGLEERPPTTPVRPPLQPGSRRS